jgi:hypothetical protein
MLTLIPSMLGGIVGLPVTISLWFPLVISLWSGPQCSTTLQWWCLHFEFKKCNWSWAFWAHSCDCFSLQGSPMFDLFLLWICLIVHAHACLVCDEGMEHNTWMLHKENEGCCVVGLVFLSLSSSKSLNSSYYLPWSFLFSSSSCYLRWSFSFSL